MTRFIPVFKIQKAALFSGAGVRSKVCETLFVPKGQEAKYYEMMSQYRLF